MTHDMRRRSHSRTEHEDSVAEIAHTVFSDAQRDFGKNVVLELAYEDKRYRCENVTELISAIYKIRDDSSSLPWQIRVIEPKVVSLVLAEADVQLVARALAAFGFTDTFDKIKEQCAKAGITIPTTTT